MKEQPQVQIKKTEQLVTIAFLEGSTTNEMLKQPGQLATIMVSVFLVLSLLNFVAPKSKVESFMVQDLAIGVVLMVTMPAIIVQRNKAMSKYVYQKYFENNILTRSLRGFGTVLPRVRPTKISDATFELQE